MSKRLRGEPAGTAWLPCHTTTLPPLHLPRCHLSACHPACHLSACRPLTSVTFIDLHSVLLSIRSSCLEHSQGQRHTVNF